MPAMLSLQSIVADFTRDLTVLIQARVNDRARAAIEAALNGSPVAVRRGPGRPPKTIVLEGLTRKRRKAPDSALPRSRLQEPRSADFRDGLFRPQGPAEGEDQAYQERRAARRRVVLR